MRYVFMVWAALLLLAAAPARQAKPEGPPPVGEREQFFLRMQVVRFTSAGRRQWDSDASDNLAVPSMVTARDRRPVTVRLHLDRRDRGNVIAGGTAGLPGLTARLTPRLTPEKESCTLAGDLRVEAANGKVIASAKIEQQVALGTTVRIAVPYAASRDASFSEFWVLEVTPVIARVGGTVTAPPVPATP